MRSSSPALFAVVLGLGILAGACRSPSSFLKSKTATTTAKGAAQAPKPRDAVVRPISSPIGASIAMAEIDQRHVAIVADDEESAIQVIDVDTKAILATKSTGGAPGQIMLAPNGTLFVAVRGVARVVALRFKEGAKALYETAHHETGDEPFGLALTPNNQTVLVTTIASSRLEAYRASDLEPDWVAPLPRDPRSIVVTADGQRAFVSHAIGSVLSVVDIRSTVLVNSGAIRAIALDAQERRRDFGMQQVTKKPMAPMHSFEGFSPDSDIDGFFPKRSMKEAEPPGVRISMKRSATQGFALAMIGDRVFLPETLVMTSDNQSIPSGYGSIEQSTLGTHVPFIARVKLEGEKPDNPELSGPTARKCFETSKPECILPRAMTSDGQNLYIACLDSDIVLGVDPRADAESAPACKETQKARLRVKVESPTGVAIDTDRKSVIAFSTFSRQLTIAPLEDVTSATSIQVPRSASAAALSDRVVEGRRLFHRSADPRIAKNGRACASCHVDGRDDALIWPTPLGKRQTPMLAGRLDGTAPYGWNGEHASLVLHIKSTLKNLEGTGLPEDELQALADYVVSMRAPKKRAVATDAAIGRGKTIFTSNETECSSCHTEDTRFTDLETHALGKGTRRFDTPSLAFVGQTAPYFHDGRFKTLDELVDNCDGIGMGKTKHLSVEQRQDLVSYLRSL